FFSSRRRHTRSKRDWSSDVCSSDLIDYTENQAHKNRHPYMFHIVVVIVSIGPQTRTLSLYSRLVIPYLDSLLNSFLLRLLNWLEIDKQPCSPIFSRVSLQKVKNNTELRTGL